MEEYIVCYRLPHMTMVWRTGIHYSYSKCTGIKRKHRNWRSQELRLVSPTHRYPCSRMPLLCTLWSSNYYAPTMWTFDSGHESLMFLTLLRVLGITNWKVNLRDFIHCRCQLMCLIVLAWRCFTDDHQELEYMLRQSDQLKEFVSKEITSHTWRWRQWLSQN